MLLTFTHTRIIKIFNFRNEMNKKTEKNASKDILKSVSFKLTDPVKPEEKSKPTEVLLLSSKEFFSKVRHNHFDTIKQQIEFKVDLDLRDERGNTALHVSCQNNHKKLAALLIDSDCDINAMNHQGKTALDYCDLLKYTDLAQYLVLQGAENSSTYSTVPPPKFLSTADISKSFR